MEESKAKTNTEKYNLVADSFLFGYARLSMARIVTNESIIGIHRMFLETLRPTKTTSKETFFSGMMDIGPKELAAFEYITTTSFLVYATTLLDSFISDSTIFLYFLHPAAIGSEHQLPFELVLRTKSKNELIEHIVKGKTRKLSYQSFVDRIKALEDAFDLQIHLEKKGTLALEHYAGIRNVMVHSQSIYDIGLDTEGDIKINQNTCPIHPSPVTKEDFIKTTRIYLTVAGELYKAINEKVLKDGSNPLVQNTLQMFVEHIKTTYDYNVPSWSNNAELLAKARKDMQREEDYSPLAKKGREIAYLEFVKKHQDGGTET